MFSSRSEVVNVGKKSFAVLVFLAVILVAILPQATRGGVEEKNLLEGPIIENTIALAIKVGGWYGWRNIGWISVKVSLPSPKETGLCNPIPTGKTVWKVALSTEVPMASRTVVLAWGRKGSVFVSNPLPVRVYGSTIKNRMVLYVLAEHGMSPLKGTRYILYFKFPWGSSSEKIGYDE